MERVGVRELRNQTSALLRRVASGETVELTDRGRTVALLVQAMPGGLDRLEQEGLLRRGEGDLLELKPMALPPGAMAPSELISRGRDE